MLETDSFLLRVHFANGMEDQAHLLPYARVTEESVWLMKTGPRGGPYCLLPPLETFGFEQVPQRG